MSYDVSLLLAVQTTDRHNIIEIRDVGSDNKTLYRLEQMDFTANA